MKTVILIAAHKPYPMPDDPVYLPIHVGCCGKKKLFGQGDDTGDNISAKNPNYCELTALYWAWKNLDYDALGLVHYRRYFVRRALFSKKTERILRGADFQAQLQNVKILLPKPRHYWVETSWSQYAHAHHEQDLQMTRQIIAEQHPDELSAFDQVMQRRTAHRFNMFVMKREPLNAYCSWLFPILFTLESRLDISGYTPNDARVFGFVAERLLDVWLEITNAVYTELPVAFMEKQNWFQKGTAFLIRKIRRRPGR
jgi:hypothetical protein